MKKKVLSLLCVLASSLILSGCGETQQPTKTKTNPTKGNPTQQQEIKSLTIDFWETFGKDIQDCVQRQADNFSKLIKEKEGVDVKVVLSYQGDYSVMTDKVTKGFAVNNIPSLAVAYPDHVASYLAQESFPGEYIVNLDDYINNDEYGLDKQDYLNPSLMGAEDFVPSFMDEGKHYIYEGTYSLPYMKSTEMMLYNKDVVSVVLKDMGIQTGTERYMREITWDQFMNLLDFVNKNRNKYGLKDADSYPLYYDSDANLFISQCYQRGIDYIGMENGKGTVLFNNDKAKDMVKELLELYQDGIMVTKGVNGGRYGSDWFKSLKSIFVVGSTGGSGYSDPGASFNVGVCKFPFYKGANEEQCKYVSQGITLCLFNNSKIDPALNRKKIEYSWKFIKYITNEENDIEACDYSAGYIPARLSCYENEDYVEFLDSDDYVSTCAKTIIEDINGRYFNYPVFKGSDVARENVGGIVKQVLLGKQSIDEAFKEAYSNTVIQL